MKNLKLILKSLVSNASCVEGGRHRPWFFAVIIALLSLAVAIIPTFVQTFTRNGDQLVGTNDYGVQLGTQRFIEDMNDNDISLVIQTGDSSNFLDVNPVIDKFTEFALEGVNNPDHSSEFGYDMSGNVCWTHRNNADVVDLQVYILTNAQYNDPDVIASISSYEVVKEEKTETVKRTGSFMVLSEKYAALYVQKNVKGALTDVGSIFGDYSYINLTDGKFFLNDINERKIGDRTTEFPIDDPKSAENYNNYVTNTWNNWKVFYKDIYNNTRLTSTWQNTLLILAIDTFLLLFMGLMIWILTRGKNNPFRIYTFWESQKIAYWCAITPALLTCGLSFLITSFSQVFFALLIGVRVMWLSMKTLRPDAVTPSQSNYSKPVKTVNTKPLKK